MKEYDEALDQDDIRPATTELLTRQRSTLMQKIEQMNAMADGR